MTDARSIFEAVKESEVRNLIARAGWPVIIEEAKRQGVLAVYSRTHNAPPDAYEIRLPGGESDA